ncbi:MAG: DsbA family oxidoreductase [Polyangiales bacterium]
MSRRPLAIDVVADVMCPWCYIGARNLAAALAELPEVDATVRHHPFLLDPSTPDGGVDLRERLRAKYGGDPDAMFARVQDAARNAGLSIDFATVRRSYPTAAAHTLLRHAEAKGTQPALLEALFDAYFLRGADVGSPAVLAEVASAHGFERDEALRLASDPAELAKTRDEARSMSQQGVTGVPFFIFGERLAAAGAQPPEALRGAILKALDAG